MLDKEYIQQQLNELRAQYAKSLSERIDTLITDLQSLPEDTNNNVHLQEIFRQIHSLSGTAATFGFSQLGEYARQLELILKEFMNGRKKIDGKSLIYLNNGVQNLQNMVARGADTDISDRYQQDTSLDIAPLPRATERLVFIVEDDVSIGQNLSTQLSQHGYKAQHFPSARAAMSALKQRKPDTMVLNTAFLEEPPDNGEQTTYLTSLLNEAIPCIFISATDNWETRLATVRAGGVAYLQKPVDISMLVDHLDKVTRHKQHEPYRVLVVDDAEELGQHYALVLRQAGMHAEAISKPSVILDKIERFKPELILLDYYFPDITGIEIAQVVRQHQEHASIPIVFLSTETARHIQLKMLGQGDDFLEKPIADSLLASLVKTRIDRAREPG